MKKFMNVVNYIFGGLFNICFAVALVLVAYNITVWAFEYGKGLLSEEALTSVSKEVVVTIPADADALEIGEILKESGLINNEYIFYLQARLNGTYKLFKSGEFYLNTNMGSGIIMDTLQSVQYDKNKDELKVTIVEGLTNKQIAEYLESEKLFTAKEFLAACNTGDFSYQFLENVPQRENRLEGYLFPDTYYLPQNPKPEDLIVRMLNRFDEVFDNELQGRVEELGLSIDEAVVMGSIIEKEIKVPDERRLASSVIYNRINQNMPLQMCSTVMYVLDKRKDRLLESDLEVKSPYNTYKNTGLPLGPICNPGVASIKAALYPDETEYLYFVVKDEKAGTHYFTNSYEDFLAAKERYNQKF